MPCWKFDNFSLDCPSAHVLVEPGHSIVGVPAAVAGTTPGAGDFVPAAVRVNVPDFDVVFDSAGWTVVATEHSFPGNPGDPLAPVLPVACLYLEPVRL